MKRPPKPKAKTLSLSSPVGDPDEVWLQEGDRRKLRPIVDSVFGQVGRNVGNVRGESGMAPGDNEDVWMGHFCT